MSNPSTASETTPLRRRESQNSEDFGLNSVGSPETQTSSSNTPTNIITNIGNQAQQLSVLVNQEIQTTPQQQQHQQQQVQGVTPNNGRIASVAVSCDNNYNIVENRLGNIGYNNNNNNNNNNTRNILIRMDTNKRILYRICLDALILSIVAIPILCFFIWGDSYKRGFFCDDESLRHPFKDSTVKNWMLYVIGLVIPVGVILTVEILRSKQKTLESNGNNTERRYVLFGLKIPDWLLECYKKIGVFAFAVAVSQLTTDIAKYTIGRLRPHFFAVCQPIILDGTTCKDAVNVGKYITEFYCKGDGSSERMLKEVTLSFPSGHSSFTFCTMVYLALYLQARMTWRGSKLMRHFLQFIFIMIAWYTALSRVSDYKHHWSDVLFGSLLGSTIAIVVAKYVSDLFKIRTAKTHMLPNGTPDTIIIGTYQQ